MINSNSKLLLDEQPLIVLPQLAKLIGLNEAIIVQQINYWNAINAKKNNNFRDGYYWTFSSYPQWLEQFPFWSEKTIKRTITSLETKGIIISGNYNKMKIDRTKWYRIDMEVLNNLYKLPLGQNDPINRSTCPNQEYKMSLPIPETNSEINSKNNDNAFPIEKVHHLTVDNLTDDAKQIYNYFIDIYQTYKGMKHPMINSEYIEQLNNITIDGYIIDVENDSELVIDIECMKDMIDWYFNDKNPMYGDRRIYHFLKPMILRNLYNKVIR